MNIELLAAGTREPSCISAGYGGYRKRLPQQWQFNHKNIYLLVGGPDGLPGECLTAADDIWSLSALTLPHFLVRLLLAEQIYRACSVLRRHPYHK